MEEKIRKVSAVAMAVLLLLSSVAVINTSSVYIETEKTVEKKKISGLELLDFYTTQSEEMTEKLEHQMQMELPVGISSDEIVVENDYIHRLVTITISGISSEYYYEHPLLGSSNHINDLLLGGDENIGIIEITFDKVYEVEMKVIDSWLYLDFISPHELYEKVIVVDAGHGGSAPGAVKQGIQEKDLNLAIVLQLKELLDEHKDWKVYYTRTEDTGPTLDERVQLANKSEANLFISVHNNSTEDGKMSDYHGTEVMYDDLKENESMGTVDLSQICLEETVAVTGSSNLGLAKGNNIYIIRTSEVPVALIEVGFMTSMEELTKLNSLEYQKQAAQGIYNGIVRALEEGF